MPDFKLVTNDDLQPDGVFEHLHIGAMYDIEMEQIGSVNNHPYYVVRILGKKSPLIRASFSVIKTELYDLIEGLLFLKGYIESQENDSSMEGIDSDDSE